ncbi:MAG: threonine ammonia-lyase, biosynthetic [Pseudomonadales bacterium]
MLEKYVKKILASKVYDVAVESPLMPAPTISRRLGCTVQFKREDLQSVYSFKLRGAYNKIARLSEAERQRGVIAASAGNHAQGVALAAQQLGIAATIVMGRNTPSIKVDAVRNLGAKVVLHGDGFDEAAAHAQTLVASSGAVFVHPFDDIDIIAGQGTVGMEILNQCHGDPAAIFVPVGGGGLVAGIAAYVKYLKPAVQIIGVESEGSACLDAAMKAGRRVRLPKETLDLFADGVSVAQIGKETFKVARHHVDAVVTVSTDEICAAVKDVFDDTRAIAEPSGALALAGLKKWVAARSEQAPPDGSLVAVISGANVNFDRLRHISERAELGEQREVLVGVSIPEQRGSFLKFARALGKRSVTEFNYRYDSDAAAHVYVGLQVAAAESRDELIADLRQRKYEVVDMSGNEAAKLHVRHMVGGRPHDEQQEWLYRFEFPERPGALLKFLSGLGSDFNITLFHYRNHGSAWGRVLVGFSADAKDGNARPKALDAYLKKIGYRYWPETENPAYQLFLR